MGRISISGCLLVEHLFTVRRAIKGGKNYNKKDEKQNIMSLVEVNNRKNGAEQSEKYLRELTKTFTGIEKPLKNVKIAETLDDLIGELHNVFNSDRVNIEYVNHLLLSYKSNPKEWKKFAKFDRFKWVLNLK